MAHHGIAVSSSALNFNIVFSVILPAILIYAIQLTQTAPSPTVFPTTLNKQASTNGPPPFASVDSPAIYSAADNSLDYIPSQSILADWPSSNYYLPSGLSSSILSADQQQVQLPVPPKMSAWHFRRPLTESPWSVVAASNAGQTSRLAAKRRTTGVLMCMRACVKDNMLSMNECADLC